MAVFGGEIDFWIVTLDRDLGEKLPFPGIVVNRWIQVGHANVMYLRPGLRGYLSMFALLRSVDRNTVLYLNSFFNRRFSMMAVFMRRLNLCRVRSLVLAPRGEFSPGAIQFKRRRKLSYIKISHLLRLYDGITWHASSDFEAADIQRQFPLASHISVAGILSDKIEIARGRRKSVLVTALDLGDVSFPKQQNRQPKRRGQLRAVFVSRLTRKKNLAGALRMLEGVSGDVFFDIYGPAEDAKYWEKCQRLIAALPPNIRVRYWGEIEHERIAQVFGEYDLFLFPTLGENFGHVISEALVSGCPVLISDQTPWRNLEEAGVGWDIPLGETERFQSVLQQCVDGDDDWQVVLSRHAMDYAAKRVSTPEVIDANRRLLQRAFARTNQCGYSIDS